jgi:hypothetical protein
MVLKRARKAVEAPPRPADQVTLQGRGRAGFLAKMANVANAANVANGVFRR